MNSLKPFEIPLSGTNLIEASAGTGKTYNITSLYVRTLVDKEISVDQILVMTFTKAATKELKDRLLKRLRESMYALEKQESGDDEFLNNLINHVQEPDKAIQKLRQAVHSFDKAAVYTIHGFCQQVLQKYAFESSSSYESEVVSDESELIQELIDDYWRNFVNDAAGNSQTLALLKYLTDQNYNPDKLFSEVGRFESLGYKKIVPAENHFDCNEALEKLQTYYEELQNIWRDGKNEIFNKLNYEHLSSKKYKKSSIPDWMEKMDQTLSADVLPIKLFKKFENFTQIYINKSLNKSAPGPLTHHFFEVAERYSDLTLELPDYSIQFKLDILSYLKKELPVKKEKLDVLSYSDQLTKIQKALREENGDTLAAALRKSYPVALVDEYQDTDPVQYDIFQSIYNKANDGFAFFMIGDPKQSIYGFRGADIFSYLKARNSIPDENVYNLARNFRSVPKLIEAINVIWGNAQAPFVMDDIKFAQVEAGKEGKDYKQLTEHDSIHPPIHFRTLSETDEVKAKSKEDAKKLAAEDTAEEIARLLDGAKTGKIKIGEEALNGSDIAVLVLQHKQADLIKEALQKKGIKSVQYSDRSVFDSDEATQLAYLLEAVISPANERLIKTALATPLMGYKPNELLQMEDHPGKWIEILDLFAHLHQTWERNGFAAMFGELMKKVNGAERLVALINGERRLTNVLHLAELLQNEEQNREGMRRLLKWMRQKKEQNKKSGEEEQLRLESDEKLVKIVTTHSSKGLEFPIVFCPFLWHGPDISEKGQVLEYHEDGEAILDFSGKKDKKRKLKRQKARREQLAEDMRLAYVAMTRAEYRCYLAWCYANSCEFSSLGYLFYGADKSVGALNHKIKGGFKGLGNKAADHVINVLCKNRPELFSCEPINRGGQNTLDLLAESVDKLRPARLFNRATPLSAGETVSSFSSLVRKPDSDPDTPDYDQFLFDAEDQERKTGYQNDMFGFPKGAGPGTCLHKIFEEINFSGKRSFSGTVAANLSLYGINSKWRGAAEKMLEITVQKQLLESEPGLALSSIQPDRFIREMEFYYKSSNIETVELLSIIRKNGNTGAWLQNKSVSGFLKGFIDLTFEFEGKYYLLDYKSNYLGDSLEDYNAEALREEMLLSSYDLQYHIYTIALHRFLQKKLPSYLYEKHFGGAFYLFLRGLNEENQNGIFFDRPDVKIIQKLDNYLLEGVRA